MAAESIEGAGVRVRRYREEDVEDVRVGCDDPLTQRFLPLLPSPYTYEEAAWWIAEGSVTSFMSGGGNFAIADPGSDRLLGGIGITHQREGSGEIGYWVAPWGRGRGVATAATIALTGYAFLAGYGRLQLRTEYENLASQRVALGAGYRREGVQRSSAIGRDGARHDLVVWARTPGDPPGPTPRLLPDLPGGTLSDGVVALRPLGRADAPHIHALYTEPDVAATAVGEPPRSMVDTARFCARAGSTWLAGTSAHFAVRELTTGELVGDAVLFDVAPLTRTAMVGYSMRGPWRRRGYAGRAVRLLSRWALRDAGLARLTAGTAPDNVASQRVLEKVGFVREGYQRGHLPTLNGGRADVVSYGLLPADLKASG
ncbi:GNAT family N-acetyltransferase [Virgisporangium aliadipatigenens]|uniref:GNAT family N-acetyltransferase n=1 Tax=Virgisporangium aliadipatigenens TaxID=741659 RepID=UPI001940B52A|nr:GNAT family N-acetyltransferase [Virgisporangium aliadipatigenens]